MILAICLFNFILICINSFFIEDLKKEQKKIKDSIKSLDI